MRSAIPELKDLKTVRQLCEEYSGVFTEGGLRWLIFNADHNGFSACIFRIGRRVLIDEKALRLWLAGHRDGGRHPDMPGSRRGSSSTP